MNGKGDKRRPMTVQYDLFEDNWDRIFKKEEPLTLREVMYDGVETSAPLMYDGMWKHSCTATLEVFYIGKDETCDYCGAWEEDGQ